MCIFQIEIVGINAEKSGILYGSHVVLSHVVGPRDLTSNTERRYVSEPIGRRVCVCVCDVIQMELLAINRLAMQFISSSAAIQWRPQVKGHSRRTRRKGHLLITIILHQVESKINSIITFNLPTLIR